MGDLPSCTRIYPYRVRAAIIIMSQG